MARSLSARLRVSGALVATSALHVGGTGSDPAADLVPVIDGGGRPYVPGTSLAGALRAWAQRAGLDVDRLWGTSDRASHVIVEDAPARGALHRERRDGVGIDRVAGTAAHRTKYDRIVLARGTQLSLRMTVELPAGPQITGPGPRELETLLFDSLSALQDGELALGAGQTRGLGEVRLENVEVRREALDRASVLEDLGKPPYERGQRVELPTRASRATAASVRIDIDWEPEGPVMVAAGEDGVGIDIFPLTALDEGTGTRRLLLPGSSVKGALRARAERIVRTVLGRAEEIGRPHHRQVDVPLVDALFGIPGRPRAERTVRHARLGRGALSVADCHGEQTIGADGWRRMIASADARAAQEEAQKGGLPRAVAAMHVALDRWTGGSAPGALYSVLEPTGATWEKLRLRVDLRRLPDETERKAALVLLWLVLRDLRAGDLPLGFGVNRGMGSVMVTGIRCSGMEDVVSLLESDDPAAVPQELRAAWSEWQADPEREAAA